MDAEQSGGALLCGNRSTKPPKAHNPNRQAAVEWKAQVVFPFRTIQFIGRCIAAAVFTRSV